jgi:hypothetical protein
LRLSVSAIGHFAAFHRPVKGNGPYIELVGWIIAREAATSVQSFCRRRPEIWARSPPSHQAHQGKAGGRVSAVGHAVGTIGICFWRRLLLDLAEQGVTGTSLRWIADSATLLFARPNCRALPHGFGSSEGDPKKRPPRWSKPRLQKHRPLNLTFLGVLGVLVVNKTSRNMQSASRQHRLNVSFLGAFVPWCLRTDPGRVSLRGSSS